MGMVSQPVRRQLSFAGFSFWSFLLGIPEISLKEERAAVKAVYDGKNVFVCLLLVMETISVYIPDSPIHDDAGKHSVVQVASLLVALMIDQQCCGQGIVPRYICQS